MQELQLQLENAFRKVTPVSECSPGIPYQHTIPGIARELLLMKRRDQKKDAAQKSLKNLKTASGRMVEVLDNLSPDVLRELNFSKDVLAKLHHNLRILNVVANNTEVRGKRSAPEKVHPYKIAKTVGWHYFCLTDRDPTISRPEGNQPRGEFFDLLTTVYRVLGVKASADSQEKKLKKEWAATKECFQRQLGASEFNNQKIAS